MSVRRGDGVVAMVKNSVGSSLFYMGNAVNCI